MKKFSGLSMIELLIAMFILTLVTTTVLKYQLFALRQLKTSFLQSIAINQIQNFFEQLQILKNKNAGEAALSQWNQQNHNLLPKGMGSLVCSNMICRISLQWHYQRDYSMTIYGLTQ